MLIQALSSQRGRKTSDASASACKLRFSELHRHEGAVAQPSSIGWTKPEKTHRSFGGRLAQQIVRNANYDPEYGFELPCKAASSVASPVVRTHAYSDVPGRMLPDHPRQLMIFVSATKDVSYGMEAAWRERHVWKTKASSLDKHVTAADAALFTVDMIMRDLIPTLSRADHCSAEIVTESRLALTAIETAEHWILPVITDIRRQTSKVEDAGG